MYKSETGIPFFMGMKHNTEKKQKKDNVFFRHSIASEKQIKTDIIIIK